MALVCARCKGPGSDVRLNPCGCTVHARCLPLSILAEHAAFLPQRTANRSVPVSDDSQRCRLCPPTIIETSTVGTCMGTCTVPALQQHLPSSISSGEPRKIYSPITTIEILPLDFTTLEKAGELRHQEQLQKLRKQKQSMARHRKMISSSTVGSTATTNSKQQEESEEESADAVERKALATSTPFLGLSHLYGEMREGSSSSKKNASKNASSGSSITSNPVHVPSRTEALLDYRRRTGRWTPAETAYVDYLITAFQAGRLPLPQGIKLNEFLSDVLQCKPSRLTKKMKNAKLSHRSYSLVGNWKADDGTYDLGKNPDNIQDVSSSHCLTLSSLEHQFLDSIQSPYQRLEMEWNLLRMWRTALSNLCLQLDYDRLDNDTWMGSLREMEWRGIEAEETVKLAERRRMGMALRHDSMSQCGLDGVFIGGIHGRDGAVMGAADLEQQNYQSMPMEQQQQQQVVQADNAISSTSAFSRNDSLALVSEGRTRLDSINSLMGGAIPRTDSLANLLAGGRMRSDSMTLTVTRSRSGSMAAPSFPSPSKNTHPGAMCGPGGATAAAAGCATTTKTEIDFLDELFYAEIKDPNPKHPASAIQKSDKSGTAPRPGKSNQNMHNTVSIVSMESELSTSASTSTPSLSSTAPSSSVPPSFSRSTSMASASASTTATATSVDDASVMSENLAGKGGAYLDVVIDILKKTKAPFECADLWVPSYLPSDAYDGTDAYESAKLPAPGNNSQNLRLCHAGHATTRIDGSVECRNLIEFGDYSCNFSFSPGKGAPGRVYATGCPTWENDIHNATADSFKRVGGAKLYGIKTLVAFPLTSPSVGRIVVVIYSTRHVPRDINLAKKIYYELQKYSPEPHWRLVVDTGTPSADQAKADAIASFSSTVIEGRDHGPSSSEAAFARDSSPSPMTVEGMDAVSVEPNTIDEAEEHEIVAMLGESIQNQPKQILASMMSLRLLLLREEKKRTQKEKDLLSVIKRSYRSYLSSAVKRSNAEVANLLARDWLFLSPTDNQGSQSSVNGPTAPSRETNGIQANGGQNVETASLPPTLVSPRSGIREKNVAPLNVSSMSAPTARHVSGSIGNLSNESAKFAPPNLPQAPNLEPAPADANRDRAFSTTSLGPVDETTRGRAYSCSSLGPMSPFLGSESMPPPPSPYFKGKPGIHAFENTSKGSTNSLASLSSIGPSTRSQETVRHPYSASFRLPSAAPLTTSTSSHSLDASRHSIRMDSFDHSVETVPSSGKAIKSSPSVGPLPPPSDSQMDMSNHSIRSLNSVGSSNSRNRTVSAASSETMNNAGGPLTPSSKRQMLVFDHSNSTGTGS